MPKIKKRGVLPDDVDDTQVKIAFQLYISDKPLSAQEIALRTGISRQGIHYHIPEMLENGVILRIPESKYTLQPFFYDKEIMESIYALFSPMATLICGNLDNNQSELCDEHVALNCIQVLMHFIGVEIHDKGL